MARRPTRTTPISAQEAQEAEMADVAAAEDAYFEGEGDADPDATITIEAVPTPDGSSLGEDFEAGDFVPSADDLARLNDAELSAAEEADGAVEQGAIEDGPEDPYAYAERVGAGYFEDDGTEEKPDVRPDDPLPEMAFEQPTTVDEHRLAEMHAGRKAAQRARARHADEVELGRRLTSAG